MSHHELRLAVASDQALVAEAVRTAMASHGFEAVIIPWPGPVPRTTVVPDVGLVVSDLQPSSRLREARALVAGVRAPWLLLTSAPRGPLWGAMLESGVGLVLPAPTTLPEALTALHGLAHGAGLMAEGARRDLQAEWTTAVTGKELLVQRVRSLTPRERTVLRLLFAGDDVRMVAELLGLSESTVRSHVKAVLRKMGVSSQLAAVSALGCLRDEGLDEWSGSG